jgi:hypothetical protein
MVKHYTILGAFQAAFGQFIIRPQAVRSLTFFDNPAP